jgi:hypothetical protein
LQGTVSPGWLWQRQGRQEGTQQRLAEMHGWFSEEFDTPDFMKARELLEELSRNQ